MQHIKRAFKMLPGWRVLLFGIITVAVLQAAAQVAIPLAVQQIIDRLFTAVTSGGTQLTHILAPLAMWFGLRILLAAVVWVGEIVSDNAFTRSVISFRQQAVERLEQLPISYYETRRAGQLTSEVNQSPQTFASWLQNMTELYLPMLMQGVFAIAVLGYKFLPVAAIVIAIGAVYWWYTFRTVQKNRTYWRRNRKVINDWSGVQTENISFVADIRALGIDKERGRLYRRLLTHHEKNLNNMWSYQHRRNFGATILEIVMYGLPILIFALRALSGKQSPTDIYVLAVYLNSITTAINRLNRMWSDTKNVDDTIGETLDILDQQNSVVDPERPRRLNAIHSFDLQDVSFSYNTVTTKALAGVNLTIRRGTTTALVGRSGSGKTTIIKLLLRFYDPDSGSVKLNDIPLPQFKQNDFRKRMGVVMQDVALFNDTVAGNIAIAQPKATLKEVQQAAKLAYAHDFITKLPDGYDTLVGERGVKLSGGEKQRISIARAILRDPELVLLDEATSALDSESEKAVQAGLGKLLADRTAVIIAHRLSTIVHADNIVVLDKGKIVQQGTYQELKVQKGVFADLLKHQEL